METTSYIALSRQGALRREMDLIANNIANMNTPAYRGQSMLFAEYVREVEAGESGTEGLSFVEDRAVVQDLREGAMGRTGNPLDLAISGPGFFVVQTEEGPRYSRDGSFSLNEASRIVTGAGRTVLDANGNPIVLPENTHSIEISADGTIATETGRIGRLDLVAFENEQRLSRQADGLYDAGEAPVLPADEARVMQGMLEGSNVRGVVEMTRMMALVRSYQGIQKLSEGEHERQLRAIRTLVQSA